MFGLGRVVLFTFLYFVQCRLFSIVDVRIGVSSIARSTSFFSASCFFAESLAS